MIMPGVDGHTWLSGKRTATFDDQSNRKMKLPHALFIVLPLCCACLPTVQAAVYSPPTDTTRAKPLVLDRGSLPVLIGELVRGWLPGEELEPTTKTDGADVRQWSSSRGFGTGDWLAWISIVLFLLTLVSGGGLLALVLWLGSLTTSIWAIVDIRKYPQFNSRYALVPAIIGLTLNILLIILVFIAFAVLTNSLLAIVLI